MHARVAQLPVEHVDVRENPLEVWIRADPRRAASVDSTALCKMPLTAAGP
jgi:hypothetical protein